MNLRSRNVETNTKLQRQLTCLLRLGALACAHVDTLAVPAVQLGSHLRGKRKREEMTSLLRKMAKK